MRHRALFAALLVLLAGCSAAAGPAQTTPSTTTAPPTPDPPSTSEPTPTTFPPATTVQLPDGPVNDSRAAAVAHAVAVEEARTYNAMVRHDPHRDLAAHCEAGPVNATADGYRVRVECQFSGTDVDGDGVVSFDGVAWGVYVVNGSGTHVVDDGGEGAPPWWA